MDPLVGAAIASAAIGSAGNVISGGSSARKQYKYQTRLMNKQYDRDDVVWNRTTEYYSPAAQRARIEAAGLNPDMMYSSGGLESAGTPSSGHAPTAPAPNYGDVGATMQNAFANSIQATQLKQSVEESNARIALLNQQAKTEENRRLLNTSITLLNDARRFGQDLSNNLFGSTMDARVEGYALNNALLGARIMETQAKTDLAGAQTEVQREMVNTVKAQAINYLSLATLNDANTAYRQAMTITQRYLNENFYSRGTTPNAGFTQILADMVKGLLPEGGIVGSIVKGIKDAGSKVDSTLKSGKITPDTYLDVTRGPQGFPINTIGLR